MKYCDCYTSVRNFVMIQESLAYSFIPNGEFPINNFIWSLISKIPF